MRSIVYSYLYRMESHNHIDWQLDFSQMIHIKTCCHNLLKKSFTVKTRSFFQPEQRLASSLPLFTCSLRSSRSTLLSNILKAVRKLLAVSHLKEQSFWKRQTIRGYFITFEISSLCQSTTCCRTHLPMGLQCGTYRTSKTGRLQTHTERMTQNDLSASLAANVLWVP